MLKDVACYLCHRDLNNYPYVVAICHSKSVKMIEVCFGQMFHSTWPPMQKFLGLCHAFLPFNICEGQTRDKS